MGVFGRNWGKLEEVVCDNKLEAVPGPFILTQPLADEVEAVEEFAVYYRDLVEEEDFGYKLAVVCFRIFLDLFYKRRDILAVSIDIRKVVKGYAADCVNGMASRGGNGEGIWFGGKKGIKSGDNSI